MEMRNLYRSNTFLFIILKKIFYLRQLSIGCFFITIFDIPGGGKLINRSQPIYEEKLQSPAFKHKTRYLEQHGHYQKHHQKF